MRVVFVNLHGNEFLVKTLNKMIFRQSVAIKHKYFLDYLLANQDVEVCSFINKHGFSMSYTSADSWLRVFRFLEHKITLKKNGIDLSKVTVLKDVSEIRPDDIVIGSDTVVVLGGEIFGKPKDKSHALLWCR